MIDSSPLPERLVRFCGADCTNCDAYKRFLAGDDNGLMNPETRYLSWPKMHIRSRTRRSG